MCPFPGIPEQTLAQWPAPDATDCSVLREALAPLADPPDGPLGALLEYGRLLLATNTVTNLTGAKDWETLIQMHFIDCVCAARFLGSSVERCADWGSGSGMPGIVWAILFPEVEFVLIEKNGKKAAFLEEATLRLELLNTTVAATQGENAWRHYGRLDALVARAVEPLQNFLQRLRRNKVGCRNVYLMQGPRWKEDWATLPASLQALWQKPGLHSYSLGKQGTERYMVHLRPVRQG